MGVYDDVPFGAESPDDPTLTQEQVDTEAEVRVEARRILIRRRAAELADEMEAGTEPPVRVHRRADLRNMPRPEPLWDGWFYTGTKSMLSAPGGVGKSALVLGLAAAMHHGVPYLGSQVCPGRTLYIAGEGEQAIDQRLAAWEHHHGYPIGSTELDVIYGTPLSRSVLRQLTDIVLAGQHALVVADTFSTLATVNSENDNAEVARWLRAFHATVLSANPTACPLVVHHVTESIDKSGRKSQKSRGASAFRDDHGTVALLTGSASNFALTTETVKSGKQKDARPRTMENLAVIEVGRSVVVVKMNDKDAAAHAAEVWSLVQRMIPGVGYPSTRLQELWGLSSNKNAYQAFRTEAVSRGLITKGPSNKDPYIRPIDHD